MKFFLAQDNSCHWYLVNADKREQWNKWCDLDEDDENSWEPPAFAKRLNGGPSDVVFENPVEAR